MGNYPEVPLASVCSDVRYGFTASASREQIGPKFLRITDIVPDRIDWLDVPFADVPAKQIDKYILCDGDIVVARTGATVGFAKLLKHPDNVVFASYLVRFRPSSEVCPYYVGAIVESSVFKEYVRQNAGGAAQPNANAQVLGAFPLPLPPLPIQRRIAGILSAYDDLIEVNTRRIKALEEMARRTYEEWFVRDRKQQQQLQTEWNWTTLGEYCRRVGGSIQTGPFGSQLHQSDYVEFGIPVVMPKDIVGGRINQESCAKIPLHLAENLKRHALVPGDIVFARRGDIGRKARVRRDDRGVLCGTGCLKVAFQSPVAASHYVSSYFDEPETIEILSGRAIGATMPNLNTQILAEMPIPLPPSERLAEFERLSEENDLLASNLARQNTNLRAQRDLLLPCLVSGAIYVSEAQLPELVEVAAE